MSTNPFLEWPFWHYYTLHIQNAPLIDDEFRKINPGDQPIPLSTFRDNINLQYQPDADAGASSLARSSQMLVNAIDNSMFYDFINDTIIRGEELDPNRVWIVTPQNFNPRTIGIIPPNDIVIIKGVARDGRGGELMPIIGTPASMAQIITALGIAQKIVRGETTNRDGTPLQRYDILSALSAPNREHVQQALQRSLYRNPTIELIQQSFRRQSSAPSDLERNATRMRTQLSKIIPEEKAINVASGALVNATAPCYNVVELQVVPPGSNDYRVVKFAFKTNMKDDDRQAYESLLRDRFRARPVQSTEVSSEQRRAITLAPIRASASDYQRIFSSGDTFQTYIQRINEATTSQNPDITQVLHGEVGIEDEDEEYYEDDYYDEDDLDNH